MNYRKLRIAWSVGWGVLCLLLIALWVRSYWRFDRCLLARSSNRVVSISSNLGVISLVDGDRSRVISGAFGWSQRPASPEWREAQNFVGFAYGRGSAGSMIVCFPIWLLIIAVLPIAVTPWLRWLHQFSLRALLIATTVVAVGLGLLVMMLRGN
jgi:hypothetical protein